MYMTEVILETVFPVSAALIQCFYTIQAILRLLRPAMHYASHTQGFSNSWDKSGGFLGLSVNGIDGAYQSTNSTPDIGSPGYAVPEPGTICLLATGGFALLRKRRV